jgi:cytochrome c oxidase subunit 3
MSTAELTHDQAQHQGAPPATCRFGMIIFLMSEAMLFAGLIGGYIVLRVAMPGEWPPAGYPDIGLQLKWPPDPINVIMIVNSLILISSSFTFHGVEVAVKKHGQSGVPWLLFTIVLGTVFLSVQAWEWMHLHHKGLWFNEGGIYGSCFFVTTGFHGMHVFIGLLLLTWCLIRQVFTRGFTGERHAALDNVGLYWHFVDAVWIVVYTSFYVI